MSEVNSVSSGKTGGEDGVTKSVFDTPSQFILPDGDEFITVKQAAALTGVTTRSISRFIEELRASQSKSFIRETLGSGGFRNRISMRAVTERFRNSPKGIESEEVVIEKHSKEIVDLYKKAITTLERERETLVEELAKKNDQIEMLEKARERSDILLQQSNERVKLLETPTEEPKKKRWWSWK